MPRLAVPVTAMLLAIMLAILLAAPAHAELRRFRLSPGSVEFAFRAYAVGLVPIDGVFARVDGILALDSGDPNACSLELRADASSLQMQQTSLTSDALGEDMMDVAHFPEIRFDGTCQGGQVVGTLLMHGVSKPAAMDVSRLNGRWIATGTVRRGDWGMGARPMLAGPEVRLTLTAGLPAGFGN